MQDREFNDEDSYKLDKSGKLMLRVNCPIDLRIDLIDDNNY